MMPDSVIFVSGNTLADVQTKVNDLYLEGYRLYGQLQTTANGLFIQTVVYNPYRKNKKED